MKAMSPQTGKQMRSNADKVARDSIKRQKAWAKKAGKV